MQNNPPPQLDLLLMTVADLRGKILDACLFQPIFLHFHAVFRLASPSNLGNNRSASMMQLNSTRTRQMHMTSVKAMGCVQKYTPHNRSLKRDQNSTCNLRSLLSVDSYCTEFFVLVFSSGSSGRVRGAEKHEIYAGAFGGHLFMTYFHRAGGEAMPPPGSATGINMKCNPPPFDLLLMTVAALRGKISDARPFQPIFLHFHAVFRLASPSDLGNHRSVSA